MSPTVTAADCFKNVADDERRRDSLRIGEDELAARRADRVRRSGRRIVDDLPATV